MGRCGEKDDVVAAGADEYDGGATRAGVFIHEMAAAPGHVLGGVVLDYLDGGAESSHLPGIIRLIACQRIRLSASHLRRMGAAARLGLGGAVKVITSPTANMR